MKGVRFLLTTALLLAVQNQTLTQRPIQSRGVLTRISSNVGDGKGIAVRVVPPKKPRYKAGAPVIIGVNPGLD